jgi:DNA-binding IclR family transcriptional regulator
MDLQKNRRTRQPFLGKRCAGNEQGMCTVVKALSLLDAFDARRCETGLVDLARLDKATTRRCGLGAALVRVARRREAVFPLNEIARPILEALARRSGGTVPNSPISGEALSRLFVCESAHANRVSVAAAIFSPSGAAMGALSNTGPALRAGAATSRRHSRNARQAAARISAALGSRLAAA